MSSTVLFVLYYWVVIFYIGSGIGVYFCWLATKHKTRYDVMWFMLFLPITSTLWIISEIHKWMSQEI